MTRPLYYDITSPKQLLALASPIRTQIVVIMENRAAYSPGEIAEYLGIPTPSVYYHINKLVKAGLLVRKGQRACTTKQEAVYELVACYLRIDWANRSPAFLKALNKAIRASHRESERMMEMALANSECRFSGQGINARFMQKSVRLSKAKLRELTSKLYDIEQDLETNNDAEQETTYVLTYTLAPILP